jgi:hypothetical protein
VASRTRAAIECSSLLTDPTFDEGSVIGFKDGQAGVEQFTLGNDDDIKAMRDLVATENLSYQSFSAISSHCAAQFLRRRDAQPSDSLRISKDERGAVAAPNPNAPLVYALELGAAPDAFSWTESHGGQLSAVSFQQRRKLKAES